METSCTASGGDTLAGNTIIGVPFEAEQPMRSLIIDQPAAPVLDEAEIRRRLFKIRAADSSGHRIKGFHQLVIEVNPRHVRYYERMLGFQVAGPRRMNRRVSAPAVLMSLDFYHARDQIARLGGCPEMGESDRSLYPFFFSVAEE